LLEEGGSSKGFLVLTPTVRRRSGHIRVTHEIGEPSLLPPRFAAQPAPLPVHGGNQPTFEASQPPSNVDELSLGLRGMVVEDDYGQVQAASYRAQQHAQGAPSAPPVPQISRCRCKPQPPRPSYGGISTNGLLDVLPLWYATP